MWQYNKMSDVAPSIHFWNAEKLSLDKNKEKNILKQIHHINFPFLKTITLNHNQIESIEPISSIKFLHLQELFLDHNHITSPTPLSNNTQFNYPSLKKISLSSNPIKDLKFLCKMYVSKLSEVRLQGQKNEGVVQSINEILKIESGKIKKLNVKGNMRIRQKRTCKRIFEKYPAAKIFDDFTYYIDFK